MRRRPSLLASALVAALLALPASARTKPTLVLRFPHFPVPSGGNVEVCSFVRVPATAPFDLASWEIHHRGIRGAFAVRHFLVYLYAGTRAAELGSGVVQSRACLDLGPADRDQRQLIASGASIRSRGVFPPGVALRLAPVASTPGGAPATLVFLLDAELVNGSTKTHAVTTRVVLRRAKAHRVTRLAAPLLERTAEQALSVPPGTIRSTEDSTGSTTADAWRPVVDTCALGITGHMHKRGRFFGVDLIGTDGQVHDPPGGLRNPFAPGRTHLFASPDYTDPGTTSFVTAQLVRAGEALHYACWQDNGVTTVPRLGCEETASVAPGIAAGLPGGGPAKPCTTAGAGSPECPALDAAYPGRTFTGACVPANLVAGPTPDDEVCALAGFGYAAAPGGCDVSALPPIE